MSELVLFGHLPVATQATRQEAQARAEAIRTGMVAITTLPEQVKAAWSARDWAALGYPTWDAYVDGEFGENRLPMISRDQRRELVADLRGASMSTRAIAAVLRVDHKTVVNDARATGEISPVVPPTRVMGIDGRERPATRPQATPASWPTYPPRQMPAPAPAFSRPQPSVFDDPEVVDAEIVDDPEPAPPPRDPEAHWTGEERDLAKQLRAGETVVVNLRGQHANLIAWAEARDLYVRIDRRSEWGNPFELPADGDRDTVIRNYADHYLAHKPSLLDKIETLVGKALGCWCAPAACHGDVLKEATGQ